jgi:AraC-like DNA-binding protein
MAGWIGWSIAVRLLHCVKCIRIRSGEGTVRTRDIDQAIEAVSKVYCPHSIQITGRSSGIDSVLEIMKPGQQPLIHLSYAAPVKIDAADFPRLYLAIFSTGGTGSARQDRKSAQWRAGETLLFSADAATRITFDQDFSQTSVKLDTDLLEATCARWLGHPLDHRVRFELTPYSNELQRKWSQVLSMLGATGKDALPESGLARRAFDEYVLALLLQYHRHNYSEEMARMDPAPPPSVVRRAEQLIRENAQAPLTVVEMANELGVGVRTLQAAFRTWRSTTPTAFLRETRLQRVREELLGADSSVSVTTAATRAGFTHLGRFSAVYRQAFGESPSVTLRRGLSRKRR